MMIERTGQILIFGGCYSNLQATEALLREAERRNIAPDHMFSTGDIIAYGADASATLRLLRARGVQSIAGNCEQQLAQNATDCGCGFALGSTCEVLAISWYKHALSQLEEADRAYMASLPAHLTINLDGRTLRLVHGNVERINAFVFPSVSNLELSRQISLSGCDAVVAGHSGIPFTRHIDGKIWHNTGSIGLPANDGTPRGWFSLIEFVHGELQIESVPLDYDYASAARAMRAAHLPDGYAEALSSGIWPCLDILPFADKLQTGIPLGSSVTAPRVPEITLNRLEILWVNTGTLCNIACIGCFMESSPTNDRLAYVQADEFATFLKTAPSSLQEIGFTGGEPFMNPDIMVMLKHALSAGSRVLVLTNAMRPMQRHQKALSELIAAHSGQISFRVSLDHFIARRHEELRGANTFLPSLEGLGFLAGQGAHMTVASRTPWGETEATMRLGFAKLFATHNLPIDAGDPSQLILFPEMDEASPASSVTQDALKALPPDKSLMCATSRMLVRRKGATAVEITPCTLLPGVILDRLDQPVSLTHAHCAQFCVYGGASCAGAPG